MDACGESGGGAGAQTKRKPDGQKRKAGAEVRKLKAAGENEVLKQGGKRRGSGRGKKAEPEAAGERKLKQGGRERRSEEENRVGQARLIKLQFPVVMARGSHLFPYRTQKLSLSALMVLGWKRPGRVGRRRIP